MAETLGTLGPNDILSCWTALWTKWDDAELTKVRMGFMDPQTTQLTECDYVGPGVSMFNKRILFHQGLLDLTEESIARTRPGFHGSRRWRSEAGSSTCIRTECFGSIRRPGAMR